MNCQTNWVSKVDLVTEGSLKNERVKQSINQDLRIIYEA